MSLRMTPPTAPWAIVLSYALEEYKVLIESVVI
jgi:hypothetical protein